MMQVAACVLHLQPWVLSQVPVPEMLSCRGTRPSHHTGHITGTAAAALIDSSLYRNAQLWRDPVLLIIQDTSQVQQLLHS